MLNAEQLEKVVALLHALHACPERSGREVRTMATIRAFLEKNTSLEVTDMGGWLLASRFEGTTCPPSAFGRTWTHCPRATGPVTGAGTTGTAPFCAGWGCCWRGGAWAETST